MSDLLHRARFWLDHRWAPARMSAYLDVELSSRRRRRMERHLGECQECRRVLAGLRTMLEQLHSLPPSSAGVDVAQMAASVRLRLGEPPGPR
ncbi:MAG: anti-sigma factor family protein [Solirubrobacteraceae bacterium]